MTLTILDFETGKVHVFIDAPSGHAQLQEFIDSWPHSSIEWMTTEDTVVHVESFAIAQEI